jgi:hypothetical protein
MITKPFSIILFLVLLNLSAFVVFGQSAKEIADLKREIEFTKQKIELKRQQIELEKQELELKRIRTQGEIVPDQAPTGDPAPDQDPIPAHTPAVMIPVPLGNPASGSENALIVVQPNNVQDQPVNAAAPAQPGSGNACTVQRLDQLNADRYQKAVCDIIQRIDIQPFINGVPNNKLSANNTGKQITDILAAKLTARPLVQAFFLESDKKRMDKQVGATPDKAGTTSLVVKGGTPALIGWAVEQGAATSSITGNTITIRANPLNLSKALFHNQGIIPIMEVREDDPFDTFLKKLSFGVSFDITRATDTPAFMGSRQQISAFSARYEFINERNPFSKRNDKTRNDFFASQTENLDMIAGAILSIIDRDTGRYKYDELNKWLDETNQELAKIPLTARGSDRYVQIATIIESQIAKIPFDQLSEHDEIKGHLESFADAAMRFKESRDKLLDKLNKGTVATFEYTNNREQIAPDTSNFRFIWEKGILGGNTDFTFNSALTIYNKKPTAPNVRRIRDFQFALQTDTRLGNRFGTGDVLLSFAGKYERLNGDTVDALGVVKPGTEGDVGFGQVKLTIPIADWGIKLPISITFANRSELIKESHVRANFGFTFDLDPLFARFKPF